MIGFLKRLFGNRPPPAHEVAQDKVPNKPPLPTEVLAEFKSWYLAQRKPAVALIPDTGAATDEAGSRLGGPAWLAEGESWPIDERGVPLEHLAQLDLSDCQSLEGYPEDGLLQFFVGRSDVYGANFDDLNAGQFLIRYLSPSAIGSYHAPPELIEVNGIPFSDFSPMADYVRKQGVPLRAQAIEDQIDQSNRAAEEWIFRLYKDYDIRSLEAFLESDEQERPLRHQSGGYPAFTQTDIRYEPAYADYDSVLLRLTSDDLLTWGDCGEAVFMIRSADLVAGDFSKAIYSWDCC